MPRIVAATLQGPGTSPGALAWVGAPHPSAGKSVVNRGDQNSAAGSSQEKAYVDRESVDWVGWAGAGGSARQRADRPGKVARVPHLRRIEREAAGRSGLAGQARLAADDDRRDGHQA